MKLHIILRILVACSLILFFALNIDRFELISSIQNISAGLTLVCILLFILSILLVSSRLMNISSIYKKMSFFKAFEINVLSAAAGYYLLPGISSEISRFYLLNQENAYDKSKSFLMLIYDRYCGLVASLSITIFGFILLYQKAYTTNIIIIILCSIIFFGAVIFLSFNLIYLKNIGNLLPILNKFKLLQNLISVSDNITKHKLKYLINLSISILIQLCSILVVYCLAYDLGRPIDIRLIIFLMPSFSILTGLPISFGGIGLREFIFVAGFVLYDVSKTVSFVVGFNYSILLFFIIILLYLFVIFINLTNNYKK